MGLLKDVTVALSDAGANILSAATQVGEQGVVRMRFASTPTSLFLHYFARTRVPSVHDARRMEPGEGANQMRRQDFMDNQNVKAALWVITTKET